MTFTREDYNDLIIANDRIALFRSWVLERFMDYTKFTDVQASRRYLDDAAPKRSIGQIDSLVDRGGWGGWMIYDKGLFNPENDNFVICHYLDNERAPRNYSDFVLLPKAFVLGEIENEERYALYLELKKEFEQ